ncbi:MAG: hypothetical protein ACK4M7_10660, partial [Burkholderiales bacterium]
LNAKEEAELLLVSARKKQKEITQEIEEILKNAEEEAKRSYHLLLAESKDIIQKRLAAIEQKIQTQSKDAIQQVYIESTAQALKAIEIILEQQAESSTNNLDTALSEISAAYQAMNRNT